MAGGAHVSRAWRPGMGADVRVAPRGGQLPALGIETPRPT